MQTTNMRRMAFPSFSEAGEPFNRDTEGLTKLEYFTAAALQGLCSQPNAQNKYSDLPELAQTLARRALRGFEDVEKG